MAEEEKTRISSENKPILGLNIESGLLLAIITAGSYCISYFYVSVYLSKLGIYPSLLNLSFEEILSKGIVILLISVSLCIIVWLGLCYPGDWGKLCWFLCSLPLFIGIKSLILLAINPYSYLNIFFRF